jgi:hypothetical protein
MQTHGEISLTTVKILLEFLKKYLQNKSVEFGKSVYTIQ